MKTCGKAGCHQGELTKITQLTVHVDPSNRRQSPIIYWIQYFYIFLIVVTIGGMLAHNGVDFFKVWNRKRKDSWTASCAWPAMSRFNTSYVIPAS